MRATKPRLLLKCPAAASDGPRERTAEFSNGGEGGTLIGGLLNLRKIEREDGSPGLRLDIYNQDPELEVIVQGAPTPEMIEETLTFLRQVRDNPQSTTAQQSAASDLVMKYKRRRDGLRSNFTS